MSSAKNSFYIGIDLGTSNSVVAVERHGSDELSLVRIPQASAPAVEIEADSLPSALYLPRAEEAASFNQLSAADTAWVSGVYARERAAEVPERVIISAKSWLCQESVNRRSQILPWSSQLELKLSPVEAATLLLAHIRRAIERALPGQNAWQIEATITVPASFDEVARQLTHEAARSAGFSEVTLLEEPIAALYSWLNENKAELHRLIAPGETILICDVGGGTTDFSLVQVVEQGGEIAFERILVGDHILLGGDNMDHALAHTVSARLADSGTELDPWQFISLVHQARNAKELLLSENPPDTVNLSVLSRGSRLFAQTISESITRAEATEIIIHGFSPLVDDTARASSQRASALREMGLAYAVDPAITRHLATFLAKSLEVIRVRPEFGDTELRKSRSGQLFLPDAVLFNGGVFASVALRHRFLEQLNSWSDSRTVRELQGSQFEQAVARGAVHYSRAKHTGSGIRIKAGSARALYVGIESATLAVPGVKPTIKGVCIVAQGLDEGSEVSLAEQEFSLTTGIPVTFRLFTSSERPEDAIGDVVADAEKMLRELPALELCIPAGDLAQSIPVTLSAALTEMGIVEVWLNSRSDNQRWKLEFDLRGVS